MENPANPIVEEIIRNLYMYPGRRMSDAPLGCESGYCLRHLRRLFEEATGETPGAFEHRVRMEEVGRRLSLTDEPVKTIALDLGYVFPRNLSREFSRYFHLSPTEFRRLNPGPLHALPGYYPSNGHAEIGLCYPGGTITHMFEGPLHTGKIYPGG